MLRVFRCGRYIPRHRRAVAGELGLSWDTVNTIAIAANRAIVVADPARLDGVRVIGVDEHCWSHTCRPGDDGYVTVIIDLTPALERLPAPHRRIQSNRPPPRQDHDDLDHRHYDADPASSSSLAARSRSLRARATRERIVPMGHPQTSAASA
ncbi:hypothetical protein MSIMFI_03095 [Mycobacterium simulans]|nr:hypothetical protein MSIMFI_03095 [Mycobacterium simulans]